MLKQCYIMSFVLWDVIAFLQHFNTFCVMCNTDWRHAHTGLEIWTHWNGLDWHALAWTGMHWPGLAWTGEAQSAPSIEMTMLRL